MYIKSIIFLIRLPSSIRLAANGSDENGGAVHNTFGQPKGQAEKTEPAMVQKIPKSSYKRCYTQTRGTQINIDADHMLCVTGGLSLNIKL